MRTADWVADLLVEAGITDVFLVTGGGAMHLNDAFGRHPGLTVTCFHHEQAAAMAAEAYFRMTNRLVCVNVTSGPGGINALNGVAGGYLDSLGMVVIAGQMKRETLVRSYDLPLRQIGDQEVDVVAMATPITKWAAAIDEPTEVGRAVSRAIHLARIGRPGPTWIEIPVDVQSAPVEPAECPIYDPAEDDAAARGTTDVAFAADEISRRLASASRPVIYAGAGIRLSGAADRFVELIEHWDVPVVTSLNGHDLLPSGHPLLVGRPGTIGDRAGNYAVQAADLVVVIGTRLPIRQVGYNWQTWAPNAFVIMIDIDAAEMAKPTLHVELPVHADAGEMIDALLPRAATVASTDHSRWLAWCLERTERYPVVLDEYRTASPVNPYVALETVFASMPADALVVAGDGWAGVGTAQTVRIRGAQRAYSNSGVGSMGHGFPAALGAALSSRDRTVVCIDGDGSLQMNIQELQTAIHYRLKVRLVVVDNGGYHSIRQTQERFFPDGLVGFDAASGVSFPDVARIATAYGIPNVTVDDVDGIRAAMDQAAGVDGPTMIVVKVNRNQEFAPKAASRALPNGTMESAPLDDLGPFLPRDEQAANTAVAAAAAVHREPDFVGSEILSQSPHAPMVSL